MSTNQSPVNYIVRSEEGFSDLEKKLRNFKIVNVEYFPSEENPEVFKKMGLNMTAKLSTLMKLTTELVENGNEFVFDKAYDKPLFVNDNHKLVMVCLLCPVVGAQYPSCACVGGTDIHETEIGTSSHFVRDTSNTPISKIAEKIMNYRDKTLYSRSERIFAISDRVDKISMKIPFDKTNKEHVEQLHKFLKNKITKIEQYDSDIAILRQERKKELDIENEDLDDLKTASKKFKKQLDVLSAPEKIKQMAEEKKNLKRKHDDLTKEFDEFENKMKKKKEEFENKTKTQQEEFKKQIADIDTKITVLSEYVQE